MEKGEDFQRLGELVGDFCDVAGRPSLDQADEERQGPSFPGASENGSREDSRGGGETPAGDLARMIGVVWEEIAGADVAANAAAVQLRAGRLVVSTSSSVWAQTLQYMEDDLTTRLNERLGEGSVKRIVFRHAGWEERPSSNLIMGASGDPRPIGRSTSVGAGGLSAEEKEAIAGLEELDLPPEIRSRMARAMKAAFVRGEKGSVR